MPPLMISSKPPIQDFSYVTNGFCNNICITQNPIHTSLEIPICSNLPEAICQWIGFRENFHRNTPYEPWENRHGFRLRFSLENQSIESEGMG